MVVGPQRGEAARWGAVTRVCRVKNPVCGAYAVLEDDRYGLLDGGKADEFARIQGLQMVQPGYFSTGVGGEWQQRDSMGGKGGGIYLEGVGCVVRDSFGGLAAGCSLAGMEKRDSKGKLDHSLVFAGLSVDSQCAVVWYVSLSLTLPMILTATAPVPSPTSPAKKSPQQSLN